MLEVQFEDVVRAVKAAPLPEVDVVVAVGTGGIVPASLLAFQLERPLRVISLNFRDVTNTPVRERPALLAPFESLPDGTRVLLVDDVSVTGSTLEAAREHLRNTTVTTLVVKGRADVVLLPGLRECVKWPWRVYKD